MAHVPWEMKAMGNGKGIICGLPPPNITTRSVMFCVCFLQFLLQMLAAISSEKAHEENGYYARRLSVKLIDDTDLDSSLPIL